MAINLRAAQTNDSSLLKNFGIATTSEFWSIGLSIVPVLDRQKTAFVTGAGGFLGSHLVEELVECGWHVQAFLRYDSSGDIGLLSAVSNEVRDSIEVIRGDIRDGSHMFQFIKSADCVFHLAALVSVPYSYAAPRQYFDTNVMGTLNILDAARSMTSPPRVLLASSSEVYGSAVSLPIFEDHPLMPQSPYAASKASADHSALSFHCSYDLPVALIRSFNAFGPRQSLRAVIPTIVEQVLTPGTKNIALGALDTSRDFVWARDIARGYAMAAAAEDDICGQTFHLATGHATSIADLAQRIIQLAGRNDIGICPDSKRLRPARSEVSALRGNADLARSTFGWMPTVDLETGLARILNSYAASSTAYKGWML